MPPEGAPQLLNSAKPSWFTVSSLQCCAIFNAGTWVQWRDQRVLNPLACVQRVECALARCRLQPRLHFSFHLCHRPVLCDLGQATQPLWVVAFPSAAGKGIAPRLARGLAKWNTGHCGTAHTRRREDGVISRGCRNRTESSWPSYCYLLMRSSIC